MRWVAAMLVAVAAWPAIAQQPGWEERERFRERMRAEREARGRPLSPEERRDIRRDITRHGQDVYRDRPHGGGQAHKSGHGPGKGGNR